MHRVRPVWIPALVLFGVSILAAGRSGAAKPARHPGRHDVQKTVERARTAMGRACTITAEGLDSTWTSKAVDDAFDEIDRLDLVLDPWNPGSELAAINAAGAERRVPCSPDLFTVLDSSLSVARETGGAFDPTVEPLERVWDFRGAGRVPEDGELSDALAAVGWTMLQVEPEPRVLRFRREHMGLDFGDLGRGYALDRAAELLRLRRVERALIDIGDQQIGVSRGEAWVIDIADPTDRLRPAFRLVLRRGAVSTAGQGEKFVTADHQRYGRMVDPRNGHPLETNATVTVVAGSALRAAGIATALLTMGRDRARAFVEDRPDLGVLWLESDSDGLHAWRWNLATLSAEPDIKVVWMP
jgi:thiamine biosynthesis lipoprotein